MNCQVDLGPCREGDVAPADDRKPILCMHAAHIGAGDSRAYRFRYKAWALSLTNGLSNFYFIQPRCRTDAFELDRNCAKPRSRALLAAYLVKEKSIAVQRY